MCVFSGCGKTENTVIEDDSENNPKILIAYFTRADNIKIDPNVDATGGDTFSILTAEYYPTNYRDSMNVAKEEQNNDARPELSNHVENMEDYDIIFLGYPKKVGKNMP